MPCERITPGALVSAAADLTDEIGFEAGPKCAYFGKPAHWHYSDACYRT
jgi:hypothetical protein